MAILFTHIFKSVFVYYVASDLFEAVDTGSGYNHVDHSTLNQQISHAQIIIDKTVILGGGLIKLFSVFSFKSMMYLCKLPIGEFFGQSLLGFGVEPVKE